jgi:hypothetical protein
MSRAIYLKFLFAGKFVLIEYLTLIYIFAYFCNAIDCFISWLYMRVLKLTLGKNIFLQIFLQFQIFSVKRPDGPILKSGQEQSCRMLT